MRDNQKPKMIACVLLTIISAISAAAGMITFDILGGLAGAIILVSILIGMTSLICIFIFRRRSQALIRMLNQERKIFTYPQDEWQRYLKHEYRMRGQEKRAIFYILSTITAIIFITFIIFIDEGSLAMIFVMVVLIGMYAFMAFVVPEISFRLRKETGEIGVLEKGIIINGTLHTWNFPLSKLSSVKELKRPFHHYRVCYDFVDRLGPRTYTIRVPFPKNEETFRDAMGQLQ